MRILLCVLLLGGCASSKKPTENEATSTEPTPPASDEDPTAAECDAYAKHVAQLVGSQDTEEPYGECMSEVTRPVYDCAMAAKDATALEKCSR